VANAGATVYIGAGTFTGSILVNKSVQLVGAGRTATILAADKRTSVLVVEVNTEVEIRSLSVTNGQAQARTSGGGITNYGNLSLRDVKVANNHSEFDGGGIANSDGARLNLKNCEISDNNAGFGGGGVFSSLNTTLNVEDCDIARNTAGLEGGGLHSRGTLIVNNATLISNKAANGGGGIAQRRGTATLFGVIIRQNETSASGAGLLVMDTMTVEGSTVAQNISRTSQGAAVSVTGEKSKLSMQASTVNDNSVAASAADGVGIDVLGGAALSLLNTTVSGNQERGVYIGYSSSANILFSTLTRQKYGVYLGFLSGKVEIGATIVAGNSQEQCHGDASSAGNNVVSDATCKFARTGDLVSTDPLLDAALKDNGGRTQTHALLARSPALDAAKNVTCPRRDQRGAPRPQPTAGVCDVGAYEACQ
jgi:hypothetical protein